MLHISILYSVVYNPIGGNKLCNKKISIAKCLEKSAHKNLLRTFSQDLINSYISCTFRCLWLFAEDNGNFCWFQILAKVFIATLMIESPICSVSWHNSWISMIIMEMTYIVLASYLIRIVFPFMPKSELQPGYNHII